jgi:hypothetical protein
MQIDQYQVDSRKKELLHLGFQSSNDDFVLKGIKVKKEEIEKLDYFRWAKFIGEINTYLSLVQY